MSTLEHFQLTDLSKTFGELKDFDERDPKLKKSKRNVKKSAEIPQEK